MMARDMYAEPYDFHYVAEDLERWFEKAGSEVIDIRYVQNSDGEWLLGLGSSTEDFPRRCFTRNTT